MNESIGVKQRPNQTTADEFAYNRMFDDIGITRKVKHDEDDFELEFAKPQSYEDDGVPSSKSSFDRNFKRKVTNVKSLIPKTSNEKEERYKNTMDLGSNFDTYV